MISIPRTLGVILVVAGGCKVSKLEPVSFRAMYRPEGEMSAITAAPACAAFRQLNVNDERSDKRLAGTRLIQDQADQSDIFIDGDVEAWFRAAVSRGLVRAQFPQNEGASLDVNFRLAAIHIEEVAYRNSTFEGRVVIDIELVDAAGGDTVWSHRTDGVSSNYGRPGNPTNYQETVNHALDRAVASAVNDGELRQALCASAGTGHRPR